MALFLVAAVLALAGCRGSASRGDAGRQRPASAAASTLCGSVPALDRLVVHRRDAFPQNHLRFSFPAEVIVTDAVKVRAAARTLCSLPEMPGGTFHCPVDLGIVYHLAFSAGHRVFPAVEADAGGCEIVRGLGALVHWAARSRDFWPELGRAMGLPSPDLATFEGSRSIG